MHRDNTDFRGRRDSDPFLQEPHFDEDAELTARRVVPLENGTAVRSAVNGVGAAGGFRLSPLVVALVVLAAIAAGAAGGIGIIAYKARQSVRIDGESDPHTDVVTTGSREMKASAKADTIPEAEPAESIPVASDTSQV